MPWTINGTALAATNKGDARLVLRSQAPDELQLVKSGDFDVAAIASGTWCELADPEGDIIFQGEAILTQGEADGGTERNTPRILGPWVDLERLTYRVGDDVRLAIEGATALDTAVSDVLTVAIGLGARFTLGTITLSGQIPAAEFDNTTCAAIVVALLRWSPGAVAWFDYSTSGTPVLHIVEADSLAQLSLPAAGCRGLQVAPRTDFQIPGVRLIFRKKIQTNYGEAEGTQVESAGTPTERGGLIMALDLTPARASFSLQKNRLTVALALPDSGDWWRSLGATSTGDPTASDSTGDTDLDYYVTAGALQSWMLATIDGVANAEDYGCTGPLASSPGAVPTGGQAFAGTEPDLHITNEQSYVLGKRRFVASFADGKTWTIELPVTDLSTSGTYYRETLTAWDEGEDAPTGLSAALYAAASRLAYSGRFRIVQAECTGLAHRPGKALNITGTGAADYATMRVPIPAVGHDIATGTTEFEFGPAAHLGAADLLELYRASRQKKSALTALDPEEEPTPVSYNAVAATASEPPGSGEDTDTGTLTVSLTTPTELDEGEIFWTAVGPETYQGNGEATPTVQAGNYTVIFHPVFDTTEGLVYWPLAAQVEVTIPPSGGDTATGTYNAVQRMYIKATGQEDDTGIDINAQDIVDLAPPTAGAKVLKVREVDSFLDGDFKKVLAVVGEPYTPE